ncbi:hypothetical protein [Acutalibacter sp. 1XD8-36]|uniref:hypothetical protein n=1 Tax=Acutalibacter sp. 1XD8-36 TaxID=2320852 RepID=UPI0014131DAF|nr:hypothetical protein [Acutalibacter sp. 1XD8-36]
MRAIIIEGSVKEISEFIKGLEKEKPFMISKWRFTRKRIQGIKEPFLAQRKH